MGRVARKAQDPGLLTEDAAAIFLYQPHWLTAARKGLQGLWEQMPISVNDLATLRWQ